MSVKSYELLKRDSEYNYIFLETEQKKYYPHIEDYDVELSLSGLDLDKKLKKAVKDLNNKHIEKEIEELKKSYTYISCSELDRSKFIEFTRTCKVLVSNFFDKYYLNSGVFNHYDFLDLVKSIK